MAYCELTADILEAISERELIGLTDDAGNGAVDASKVTRAIADADAEIDSYCASRYDVPFASTPDIVRKCSVDIAIYNLYALKSGAPETRRQRYQDAIAFLKAVSKGDARISDESIGTESTSDRVAVSSSDRVFSRDNLNGF